MLERPEKPFCRAGYRHVFKGAACLSFWPFGIPDIAWSTVPDSILFLFGNFDDSAKPSPCRHDGLFGVSDYKSANTAIASDHELQSLPQYVQVSTACCETAQNSG
jgi:hypothetical protein